MGKLIWSMWANLLALSAAPIFVIGGLLGSGFPQGTFEKLRPAMAPLFTPVPVIPIISILTGLFVMAIEWPLPGIRNALGAVATDYRIRIALYYPLALFCFFSTQSINGSLALIIATTVLLKGHMDGEVDMKLPNEK